MLKKITIPVSLAFLAFIEYSVKNRPEEALIQATNFFQWIGFQFPKNLNPVYFVFCLHWCVRLFILAWVVLIFLSFIDFIKNRPRVVMEKDLNQQVGSDEWWLRGRVLGVVPECRVHISSFVSGNRNEAVKDMRLRWHGGGEDKKDVEGEEPIFNLASVSGHAASHLVFRGFVEKVNGDGDTVTPGIHQFKILLLGKGVKKFSSVKIKVKPGGGKNCVEVLEG